MSCSTHHMPCPNPGHIPVASGLAVLLAALLLAALCGACAEMGEKSETRVAMEVNPSSIGGTVPVSSGSPNTAANNAPTQPAGAPGGGLPSVAPGMDAGMDPEPALQLPGPALLCATEADCSPGQACVSTGASAATCHDTCITDSECGAGGSRCLAVSDTAAAPLSFCSRPCSPLSNLGCAPGEACDVYAIEDGGSDLYTTCRPDGALQAGSECDSAMPDACSAGTSCASGTASTGEPFQACLERCDVSKGLCDNGQPCYPNSPPAIVDGIELGLCP